MTFSHRWYKFESIPIYEIILINRIFLDLQFGSMEEKKGQDNISLTFINIQYLQ